MRDSIERFSDRADNYAKFRPSYPDVMVRFLRNIVAPPAIVADIGSGTGILTRQLLESGYELFAVEPNDLMRAEAERILGDRPLFSQRPWHRGGDYFARSICRPDYLCTSFSLVRPREGEIGVLSNSERNRQRSPRLE